MKALAAAGIAVAAAKTAGKRKAGKGSLDLEEGAAAMIPEDGDAKDL